MTFTKAVLGLRVTPAQKLILLAINGERAKVIPIKTIQRITKLSPRAIKSSIQALAAQKFIFVEPRSDSRGRYAASRYVINTDGILESAAPCANSAPGHSAKFAPLNNRRKASHPVASKIHKKEEINQVNIIDFPVGVVA